MNKETINATKPFKSYQKNPELKSISDLRMFKENTSELSAYCYLEEQIETL